MAAPSLYSVSRLLGEFNEDDPRSYALTFDARTYLRAVVDGLRIAHTDTEARRRAVHDAAISRALLSALEGAKVVAVMGGHELARSHHDYRAVAQLAKNLTERGYLMVSGGGPGAMEATHLGARLAGDVDVDLAHALKRAQEGRDVPIHRVESLRGRWQVRRRSARAPS